MSVRTAESGPILRFSGWSAVRRIHCLRVLPKLIGPNSRKHATTSYALMIWSYARTIAAASVLIFPTFNLLSLFRNGGGYAEVFIPAGTVDRNTLVFNERILRILHRAVSIAKRRVAAGCNCRPECCV